MNHSFAFLYRRRDSNSQAVYGGRFWVCYVYHSITSAYFRWARRIWTFGLLGISEAFWPNWTIAQFYGWWVRFELTYTCPTNTRLNHSAIITIFFSGRRGIWTPEGVSQRIYSPPQLATLVSSQIYFISWEQTDSNRRPSACKADALNQLSYAPDFSCRKGGTRTLTHKA